MRRRDSLDSARDWAKTPLTISNRIGLEWTGRVPAWVTGTPEAHWAPFSPVGPDQLQARSSPISRALGRRLQLGGAMGRRSLTGSASRSAAASASGCTAGARAGAAAAGSDGSCRRHHPATVSTRASSATARAAIASSNNQTSKIKSSITCGACDSVLFITPRAKDLHRWPSLPGRTVHGAPGEKKLNYSVV